nr:Uncharacterised protein [Raoultella sp. NCTC 9187]
MKKKSYGVVMLFVGRVCRFSDQHHVLQPVAR